MNVRLTDAEQLLVRQVAEVVAEQIRDDILAKVSDDSVVWSRDTAAQKLSISTRTLDDMIADGEIRAFRTGLNGGGKTLIDPDSCYAWKRRRLMERRR